MSTVTRYRHVFTALLGLTLLWILPARGAVPIWDKVELSFTSSVEYKDPLYDVRVFELELTSPGGRTVIAPGFWDGGYTWKVRFMPGETGTWSYVSRCSDRNNQGLNGANGTFECVPNASPLEIYSRGAVSVPPGSFHLAYADGTPFFWLGCTAWNGAMKSTADEWDTYLQNRAQTGFSLIQFVIAPWRGCAANRLGQVAFTGSGRIKINPGYFKLIDEKIDRINDHGLVAAPVLLWALQYIEGRELSPGYYLPDSEAIMLARYMVARYNGNHVVWVLGGDGKYIEEYEQRWKNIGRGVFADGKHQGAVTTHPQGHSWYGDIYQDEHWLDIVAYQSSHSTSPATIDFITKGPASRQWDKLPPRPIVNMEPVYERIFAGATPAAVRNAAYWSVLATPPAGVSYGTNGIWAWLHEGELILNHNNSNAPHLTWKESLDLPGGKQMGLLAAFFKSLPWWKLRPAQDLLAEQPGGASSEQFVSAAATADRALIVVYLPSKLECTLYNPSGASYTGEWFDPRDGGRRPAELAAGAGRLHARSPLPEDAVLVLRRTGI